MEKTISAEVLESNWNTFVEFSKRVGDYNLRNIAVEKMLMKYETRIATCPASSKISYHNAFPGGLVDHSLRVLKFALQLKKLIEIEISSESVIMAALFHDLGKIGSNQENYFIDQDSDWHRKQGSIYKINDKIQFMPTAQRSLYLLQLNNITLTQDEFIAILIHDGPYCKENEVWSLREPGLATLIHQADYLAMKREKGEL